MSARVKRVMLESPFRPILSTQRGSDWYREELRKHIAYAQRAMLDSLTRGEAPFPSHLLYTQCWSEDPDTRRRGISASDEWARVSDLVVLYTDLGVTPGMLHREDFARAHNIPVERRSLGSDLTVLYRSEVFAELAAT